MRVEIVGFMDTIRQPAHRVSVVRIVDDWVTILALATNESEGCVPLPQQSVDC